MKITRKNVFETNSSSTHSVSVSGNSNMANAMILDIDEDDNKVHVCPGEFGWEIETYTSVYKKLQYIVTMLLETEGNKLASVDELFETEGFKLINSVVADYCNCDGIYIDDDMSIRNYDDWYYLKHNGYIDHQSCEDYQTVQDFLDDYGVDATDFIFNYEVTVHTDNDNY